MSGQYDLPLDVLRRLFEFLRARLDEDDAVAVTWQQAHDPTLADAAARVLAEVAAKRAIMAAAEADDPSSLYGGCGDDCEARVLDWVVRLLAETHAEHPDFDPAWRI